MFKYVSLINRLFDYLDNEISKRNVSSVVWLGDHIGFSVIFKFFVDRGIEDIRIMDNSKSKQGRKYKAWKCPEKYTTVQPILENTQFKPNTLFLLSNTHYKEFAEQLKKYDVKEDDIIDLLYLKNKWMYENETYIKDCIPVSGRELQLISLDVLKHFKCICNELNLKYFLAEGTMIGAVRHKGFIPWDDDIDVFMPFEDYLKFIELYTENPGYELIDWRKYDYYPIQFAKLVSKETYLLHPAIFAYSVLGCGIDIFPIAGYPSDKEAIEKKWKRNLEMDELYKCYCCTRELDGYEIDDCRQEIIDEKYGISFYEASMVGTMQQINFAPWTVRKEAFSETMDFEFEDDVFSGPKGYDEYLSTRYGDYMTLPPVEKRVTHPYPTFKIVNNKSKI